MLRRINHTTIRLCAQGTLFLALGFSCYMTLRPQSLAVFPLWLWQAFEPLRTKPASWLAELIGALPSLTHTAGILLLLAAALHAWPRRLFAASALWLLIEVIAESGERGGFLPWRGSGTFDPLDLIAIISGAGLAAILIWREYNGNGAERIDA